MGEEVAGGSEWEVPGACAGAALLPCCAVPESVAHKTNKVIATNSLDIFLGFCGTGEEIEMGNVLSNLLMGFLSGEHGRGERDGFILLAVNVATLEGRSPAWVSRPLGMVG